MRCPHCKNRVLQKSGNSVKLRTHGPVEFRKGGCSTRCHWCKRPVVIPISLESEFMDDSPQPQRFVLHKGVRK